MLGSDSASCMLLRIKAPAKLIKAVRFIFTSENPTWWQYRWLFGGCEYYISLYNIIFFCHIPSIIDLMRLYLFINGGSVWSIIVVPAGWRITESAFLPKRHAFLPWWYDTLLMSDDIDVKYNHFQIDIWGGLSFVLCLQVCWLRIFTVTGLVTTAGWNMCTPTFNGKRFILIHSV